MTDFKIDPDAMKGLVLKAILESWDEETRNQLVSDAIGSLLKEKADGRSYGNGPTVIESIVRDAMRTAARTAVTEIVDASAELKKIIRDAVAPVVDTALGDGTINLDSLVAEALVAKIKEGRGY
jgi:hypothetical protein